MSGSIMNAAVMGMNAQTNWLATISQNIANSSTTGYKDAETEFSSLVNQSGASNYSAGGVATTAISMNGLQGGVVGTSTVTDLAVQGNGFFVVGDAAGDTFLTRNGSFVPDASGNLVNSAGYYLMGTNVQSTTTPIANSLAGLVKVNVTQTGEQSTPTTTGTFSANLPSTAATVAVANAPAAATAARPPATPTYTEKTSLVTYDNLGAPVTLDVYMTRLPDNPATNPAATPPVVGVPNWEVDVFNAADGAPGGGFPYSTAALTSQVMTFNPSTGQLASGGSLSVAIPNGQTMALSLAGTTQLATGYAVTGATTNGNAPDTLTGVTISTDGTLSFNYCSGTSMPGYDIPLANVASPDDLTSVNGTVFSTNVDSGQPQVSTAGIAGFGSIESSSLENSTVDLSTELTAMIQAQKTTKPIRRFFRAALICSPFSIRFKRSRFAIAHRERAYVLDAGERRDPVDVDESFETMSYQPDLSH